MVYPASYLYPHRPSLNQTYTVIRAVYPAVPYRLE